MKPEDLRIGNFFQKVKNDWYSQNFDYTPIANIVYNGVNEFKDMGASSIIKYSQLKPIELTAEWKLKFGFEKIDHISGYSFWRLKRKKRSNTPAICIYDTYIIVGSSTTVSHINSVHQLQNLFFALTGKELPLNPQSNV